MFSWCCSFFFEKISRKKGGIQPPGIYVSPVKKIPYRGTTYFLKYKFYKNIFLAGAAGHCFSGGRPRAGNLYKNILPQAGRAAGTVCSTGHTQ
jgi:hypothetical protein